MDNTRQRISRDEILRLLDRYLPDIPNETIGKAADRFLRIIYEGNAFKAWIHVLKAIDSTPLTMEHIYDVILSTEMFLDVMIDRYHLNTITGIFSSQIKGLTGLSLTLSSKCAALDFMVITSNGATMASAKPCHRKLYDILNGYHQNPESFSDPSFYVKSITAQIIIALSFYTDGTRPDEGLINDPAIRKAMECLMGWKEIL